MKSLCILLYDWIKSESLKTLFVPCESPHNICLFTVYIFWLDNFYNTIKLCWMEIGWQTNQNELNKIKWKYFYLELTTICLQQFRLCLQHKICILFCFFFTFDWTFYRAVWSKILSAKQFREPKRIQTKFHGLSSSIKLNNVPQ